MLPYLLPSNVSKLSKLTFAFLGLASDGTWYLLRSYSGFTAMQFGISTDKPVPADYDNDGRTDIAVFREGNWYLQQSTAGFRAIQFGAANDIPVPNAFLP